MIIHVGEVGFELYDVIRGLCTSSWVDVQTFAGLYVCKSAPPPLGSMLILFSTSSLLSVDTETLLAPAAMNMSVNTNGVRRSCWELSGLEPFFKLGSVTSASVTVLHQSCPVFATNSPERGRLGKKALLFNVWSVVFILMRFFFLYLADLPSQCPHTGPPLLPGLARVRCRKNFMSRIRRRCSTRRLCLCVGVLCN